MKLKIVAFLLLLLMCAGCASYQYKAESCFPYAEYRTYRGPFCSPLP